MLSSSSSLSSSCCCCCCCLVSSTKGLGGGRLGPRRNRNSSSVAGSFPGPQPAGSLSGGGGPGGGGRGGGGRGGGGAGPLGCCFRSPAGLAWAVSGLGGGGRTRHSTLLKSQSPHSPLTTSPSL